MIFRCVLVYGLLLSLFISRNTISQTGGGIDLKLLHAVHVRAEQVGTLVLQGITGGSVVEVSAAEGRDGALHVVIHHHGSVTLHHNGLVCRIIANAICNICE